MQYAAYYFDGKTAARSEVVIEPKGRRLGICQQNGAHIDTWRFRRIKRSHPIIKEGPLRLRNGNFGAARLVVHDPNAIADLVNQLPCLFERQHKPGRLLRAAVTLALITVFLITTTYFAIPRLARPIAGTIPIELENQIGRAARQSLTREWAQCTGPGNAELSSLVDRLERQLDAPYKIEVSVVKASLKNAFALPGGHIVITNALLSFMESPDELAGVLAHEMGHVALRHPLENMLSQLGVLLAVNVIMGGGSSDVAGLGALFATTSYTRDYELLADDFALDLLHDAQISSSGYANLFERFNKTEQDTSSGFLGLSDLLRTHPLSIDRAALAAQAPDVFSVPTLDESGWTSILELCREEGEEDSIPERVDKRKPISNSLSENELP